MDERQPTRRIERSYRVRFEEVTPEGTIRPALFLSYAQDCAWQHSAFLGYDRDWYDERGIFWLVRAVALDVLRPVATYSELTVSTEVMGFRRATARRHTEVRDGDGTLVASADIDWLLLNQRGMPARIPPAFEALFDAASQPAFEINRVPLPASPPNAVEWRFEVRRRDIDPMDHVNNSVYVDYLEEALERAGQADLLRRAPRRYTMEFVGAAACGEVLVAHGWPEGSGWAYRLQRGGPGEAGGDEAGGGQAAGDELFRARAEAISDG